MGNVNMEASQINYRGGQKKMSVEEALKNTSGEAAAIAQLQTDVLNLNSNKANQITIAPFFSAEASYDPGDLVYYNGLSYRCVNAHEGKWDADDFAATTIAGELDALKRGLTSVEGKLVTVLVSYSSTDRCFPLSVGTPEPALRAQITMVGRNISNGAIYALWYDSSVRGIRFGGTISGDAPQNGESVYVQYFA